MKILIHPQEDRNYPFRVEFQSMGYEVEIANIAGDIAVPELGIGIERKTMSDFLNSVMDGRIFSQADEMALIYDDPWVVIDDADTSLENLKPAVYWGTIWSLRKHHHCNFDLTFGNLPNWVHYAIQKIINPAKHYTDPVRYGARKVDPSDTVMHILMALPGIGPKKAQPFRDMKLIPAIQALKPKVKESFRGSIE
jgi:ERCC4-type nuclease